MGLVNLSDYKNTIIAMLLADQTLCKYLYYDDDNPLALATISDTSVLSDKDNPDRRIFAIPFNSSVHSTQMSTLHIQIDQPNSGDVYFKKVNVTFIILCHNHLWELYTADDSVKLRPDMIVERLGVLFHRTSSIGLGKASYGSLRNIYLNDEVSGYKLVFENIDFSENN